ncbi:hypothetical protein IFM89_030782 [Coptis chinensis]|uniref:Terpene cyclase/mutase family member n=1 Tax=Coptis chinensis TaxID=261450 RepID=A0A835M1X1_9MAGN|nr:hypothetical protein IFM89_030782 [Coptis chinensis]
MWKLKVADNGGGPYGEWLYSTNNFVGRQIWEFDPNAGSTEEQAEVEEARQEFHRNRFQIKPCGDVLLRLQMLKENKDKFDLSIPPVKVGDSESATYDQVTTTLRRATRFFSTIQTEDGHWAADIGGPLFFTPPLVFALYITGMLDTILSQHHKKEILRYTYCHQNEDGGWGFHIEGHSTMFGTTLNYICMRMLGEGPDGGEDNACARGRQWIRDHGGVTSIPSWGKTWLSLCHAAKMWCYCRLVYMPMSYLYGRRFVGPMTDLILSLREELHVQPYGKINWTKTRHICAKEDLYYPPPLIQNLIWDSLLVFTEPLLTRWPLSKLREKALQTTMKHVHYEDENSRYITIGCVEKMLCMLACWVENPNSDAFKKHLARVPDYLWVAEDGMRVQSFGSQTWDTSFAVQAIIASNLYDEMGDTLRKGHDFVKQSQSCLLLSQLPKELVGEKMEPERLYDSVNLLLSLQSENGGLSAWEPATGHDWLEVLNPTEFFQDIVIEHEYVECTASAIQALVLFKKLYPGYRKKEIEIFIAKAVHYLEENQMPDGSWYGSWGICFIYGTWFALKGLTAAGRFCYNSPTVRKACDFLLSTQTASGGWGESYRSCPEKAQRDPMPSNCAVKVLINNQMENGDFPQQEISGVFMKNCMLHYAAFRNIFPLWALAEYHRKCTLSSIRQ